VYTIINASEGNSFLSSQNDLQAVDTTSVFSLQLWLTQLWTTVCAILQRKTFGERGYHWNNIPQVQANRKAEWAGACRHCSFLMGRGDSIKRGRKEECLGPKLN